MQSNVSGPPNSSEKIHGNPCEILAVETTEKISDEEPLPLEVHLLLDNKSSYRRRGGNTPVAHLHRWEGLHTGHLRLLASQWTR